MLLMLSAPQPDPRPRHAKPRTMLSRRRWICGLAHRRQEKSRRDDGTAKVDSVDLSGIIASSWRMHYEEKLFEASAGQKRQALAGYGRHQWRRFRPGRVKSFRLSVA